MKVLASFVLALAASVVVYPWLPDRVPVHFNLAGHPDGFAPRVVGALLLPAFIAVAIAIGRLARAAGPAMRFSTELVAWFFLGLHVLVLRAALTGSGLGGALWLLVGTFFVAIGLVLPRVRRNRWVGVRTPWSMRSPEVWARTQRVGGAAMIAAGALLLLSSGAPTDVAAAIRALAILGAAFVSVVYSWWASRSLPLR